MILSPRPPCSYRGQDFRTYLRANGVHQRCGRRPVEAIAVRACRARAAQRLAAACAEICALGKQLIASDGSLAVLMHAARQVFAQSYPRYLLRVVNRHEEFYALLMFLVERHYLRTQGMSQIMKSARRTLTPSTTGASFAENFYGLKRRRRPVFETDRAKAAVGGVPSEEKLRDREVWRSLVFLVAVPYLRAKAQDYFEALGGGVDHDVLDESMNVRQQQALSEPVSTFPQGTCLTELTLRLRHLRLNCADCSSKFIHTQTLPSSSGCWSSTLPIYLRRRHIIGRG